MDTYRANSRVLSRSSGVSDGICRSLQGDLRSLGYLRAAIDGRWGSELDQAIRSIRIDLCNPSFSPAIAAANSRGMVVPAPATGPAALEPSLADCIGQLIDNPAIVKLPVSANAVADNRLIMAAFRKMRSTKVPIPFLAAMFQQESGGRHYAEPTGDNTDSFVITGLDRNDAPRPDRITSRGYGLGQYTLFHHPPTPAECASFIDDPVGNVQMAIAEFRSKYDGSVHPAGAHGGADDFLAEHPLRKPVLCRYTASDPRFLTDCRACAVEAGTVDCAPGTPVYPGSTIRWDQTAYYPDTGYDGVPRRAAFACDWPYAARRYNGGGINSYHYQARILRNLLS